MSLDPETHVTNILCDKPSLIKLESIRATLKPSAMCTQVCEEVLHFQNYETCPVMVDMFSYSYFSSKLDRSPSFIGWYFANIASELQKYNCL